MIRTRSHILLFPVLLALAVPAFANPTVSSPGSGAVTSPFTLSANASGCSGQPVSVMGYSLDNSTTTTTFKGTSIDTRVSAPTGNHTLHVKAWGDKGASCVTDVAIDVTGSTSTTTTAAASTTTSGITVSSPANGATVSSPFNVAGTASTCSGQPVSAMAYSLDNKANAYSISGTSLQASASASAGAHTVHVKSWGKQGASCVANIAVTVGSSSGATSSAGSGPSIPSTATSVSSIEVLSSWKKAFDGGTSGSASGTMTLVGSPAVSGNSRKFATSFSGGGGERYWVSFGDDTSATNFLYDGWVYLDSSAGNIANLEMDLNQVMSNGQTVIFGFQCDGYNGIWDVTENAGSASAYKDHWVHSSAKCNPRNWTRNTWHHVQISYSRNSSGTVTYHTVWLDGAAQPINITVYSAFALGWGPSMVTNFQVDGLNSGSNNVYLDKLTIYRW